MRKGKEKEKENEKGKDTGKDTGKEKENEKEMIWYPYTRFGAAEPVVIREGYKEFLVNENGEKIIDAVSSWWTNVHGHSHPKIVRAVSDQIATLDHLLFSGFTHHPAQKLASMLLKLVPGRHAKVFYSDNGSTAVEVALKMSLQYWSNLIKPRKKILAFNGSYHGDTFGAMAVSERGSFTAPFRDKLFDVVFIDPPVKGKEKRSAENLEKILKDEPEAFASFIYEPLVMGTAGMKMYSAAALDPLLALAKKYGVLCIADEVMTGFGRTGKLFASEYMKSKPDIVCMSKGITGGVLPLGVTTATKDVYAAFASPDSDKTFYHGHSYTGNPISIAASVASTTMFMSDANVMKRITAIGKHHQQFKKTLLESYHDKLDDVRVQGTILAMDLKTKEGGYHFKGRDELYAYFISKGILLRPLGNVLYVMPPYCISEASLKKVYKAIINYLDTTFTVS